MNEFFALMQRMKYIERWGLMRKSEQENVLEHSATTAMFAHALALIENRFCGDALDAEHIALMGLYHESAEVLTGDLPTPVKYYNDRITEVYKEVEHSAEQRICETLPKILEDELTPLVRQRREGKSGMIVKAADKLAALVKCKQEVAAGNREFSAALDVSLKELKASKLKSVEYFLSEILPSFDKNLDDYFSRAKQ